MAPRPNGQLQFKGNLLQSGLSWIFTGGETGAITIGDAGIFPRGFGPETITDIESGQTLGREESFHSIQGRILGPVRSQYSSALKPFRFPSSPSTPIRRGCTQRISRFRLVLQYELVQNPARNADPGHSHDLPASMFPRPLPEPRGAGDRRTCAATATRGVCPETPQAEAISTRPSFLGRALAPLATT
jgi:hypothetical protein